MFMDQAFANEICPFRCVSRISKWQTNQSPLGRWIKINQKMRIYLPNDEWTWFWRDVRQYLVLKCSQPNLFFHLQNNSAEEDKCAELTTKASRSCSDWIIVVKSVFWAIIVANCFARKQISWLYPFRFLQSPAFTCHFFKMSLSAGMITRSGSTSSLVGSSAKRSRDDLTKHDDGEIVSLDDLWNKMRENWDENREL